MLTVEQAINLLTGKNTLSANGVCVTFSTSLTQEQHDEIAALLSSLSDAKTEAEEAAQQWEGIASEEQTKWGEACQEVTELQRQLTAEAAGAAAMREIIPECRKNLLAFEHSMKISLEHGFYTSDLDKKSIQISLPEVAELAAKLHTLFVANPAGLALLAELEQYKALEDAAEEYRQARAAIKRELRSIEEVRAGMEELHRTAEKLDNALAALKGAR